jgi:hypothetical protein
VAHLHGVPIPLIRSGRRFCLVFELFLDGIRYPFHTMLRALSLSVTLQPGCEWPSRVARYPLGEYVIRHCEMFVKVLVSLEKYLWTMVVG